MMNPGNPGICLSLEGVQPTHRKLSRWSKGGWSEDVSGSEGAAAWLTTCGAAGGGSQARGKDKKTFPAHLGFSVPSSAARQGAPNNITRASKLMPVLGTDAWKMGSISPNGHCCLISSFLEPLTLAEDSPEPFWWVSFQALAKPLTVVSRCRDSAHSGSKPVTFHLAQMWWKQS